MWTPHHEQVLEQLRDDGLVRRLWDARAKPSTLGPAPGAHGLVRLLREHLAKGDETGDLDEDRLSWALERGELSSLPPELLHHIALWHGRLAHAVESFDPDRASGHQVRSLEAWRMLFREQEYLTSRAIALTRKSKPGDVAEILDRFAANLLAWDVDRLREGAARLSRESSILVTALGTFSEQRGDTAMDRHASARHAELLDAALAPAMAMLEHVGAEGGNPRLVLEPTARFVAVWKWSGRTLDVEVATLTKLEPWCWTLYRAHGWDDLKKIIRTLWPVVESLEQRVIGEQRALSYASLVAEMLTFGSQLESGNRERNFAERAVRACPEHRNGRLILANVLCHGIVRDSMDPLTLDALARMKADLARVEGLWPDARQLPEAREAVAKVERLLGIAR